MTIQEQIENLKQQIFYLDMKDRWTSEDYITSRTWHSELRKLEKLQKEG